MPAAMWALILLFVPASGFAALPSMRDGTIHLEVDVILREPVKLNGAWSFKFNQSTRLIDVPGSWTLQGYPAQGVGLYELVVNFDRDIPTVAIHSEFLATQYRVFANGNLVFQHGDPGQGILHYPEFIEVPVHGRRLVLGIEVSNTLDFKAGLIRPVLLGRSHALIAQRITQNLTAVPLLAIACIMAVYFIGGRRRLRDDRHPWELSCLCLTVLLFYAYQLILQNNQTMGWAVHTSLFFTICIAYYWFLERSIARESQPGIPLRFRSLSYVIPLASTLLLWLHPQHYAPYVFAVSILHFVGYILFKKGLFFGLQDEKKPGAIFSLALAVVFLLVTAHDALCYLGAIDSFYFSGYLLLPFLLNRAYLLEIRHSSLEKRNARVEAQRAEIVMAQRICISSEVSPLKSGAFEYASCFLPADEAGGDWIFMREAEGRLYFFLADVTGHGFRSALMTIALSSAVTAVLEQETADEHPGRILEKCALAANRAVHRIGLILEKYSTLSLNCLELNSGRVFFIQAGHMPTFLANDEKVSVLQNQHGILGVDPDAVYHCKETSIQPLNKLFIYSDGLTDTHPSGANPLRVRGLQRILMQARTVAEINHLLKRYLLSKVMDDVTFVAIRWLKSSERTEAGMEAG